ncbi:hypothetical protein C8R43DRAFT_1005984 [Mycena crocata]|nr:hypothetical protein C8R43DRAFT_1005984 [Mycena crocata]
MSASTLAHRGSCVPSQKKFILYFRCYTSEASFRQRFQPESKRRPLNIISTLNAALISSGDFLHLSHRVGITMRFPHSVGLGSQLRYAQERTVLESGLGKLSEKPFPADSQGFLYYNSQSPVVLDGSLRFRITSDSNPSSFHCGRDLLLPSGFPWQISLLQLACHKEYTVIRQQLLHECLITEEQRATCVEICGSGRRITPSLTLFRLDSPFLVDFSSPELSLVVVGKSIHRIPLNRIFTDSANGERSNKWTGMAIARFEPSTRPEHAGRRVLHLRIMKITQPVVCTAAKYRGRIVQPREGDLFTVCDHHGVPGPWAYDIDKKAGLAVGLRALWDASRPPS